MTSTWIRSTVALALGSLGLTAVAASVNLNGRASGDHRANVVDIVAPNYLGAAGGFKGLVNFDKDGELGFTGTQTHFITYSVEIDENIGLPRGLMTGYTVVGGGGHTPWTNANGNGKTAAATADRLGQLLSYAGSATRLVDTDEESTSLQLAIWNVVYDSDNSVTSGSFRERTTNGAFNAYANELLTQSMDWAGVFDVFVLAKSGSPDFLLTRDGGRKVTVAPPALARVDAVPEPASLALAVMALGAAGANTRRRRAAA